MIMRWINSATLFASGILYLCIGYVSLGNSRFSGLGLLWGAVQMGGAAVTARKGEVEPIATMPRIIANGWALIFWYSAAVAVVLKIAVNDGGDSGNAGIVRVNMDTTIALLPVFIIHAVTVAICPVLYFMSQFSPGRRR